MTLEQLKRMLPLVEECKQCGFCANDPPTKEEMCEIIEELIMYKERDEQNEQALHMDGEETPEHHCNDE